MKLINVEPKENYIVRVYLDNQSIIVERGHWVKIALKSLKH